MYKQHFLKPDGRALTLYGLAPVCPQLPIPSPSPVPVAQDGAHLRWHPLRGEWVAYAGHRQNRTFLPPKEFNPLAPTKNFEFPTELPQGKYDIAVFDNMFPTLGAAEKSSYKALPNIVTAPAAGACEVVVFSQDPNTSLARMRTDQVALLLEVWGERTAALGSRPEIQYVMPFENRGVEVGVTLHHPHGQIYAYPFIPPVPARQLELQISYWKQHGRGLLNDFIEQELAQKTRILYTGSHAVAFVPACARYPYEVWVAPKVPVAKLDDLGDDVRKDIAKALRTVLLKYDGLWSKPFPYLMVVNQAPTDGTAHPECHVHLQLSPAFRSADKLKYLAGTELGAGMFANDSFPEEKAAELRAVEVVVD